MQLEASRHRGGGASALLNPPSSRDARPPFILVRLPPSDGGEEAGNGLLDALTGLSNRWGKMATTTYAVDYEQHVGPLVDFSMTSGVGRTYRYLDTVGVHATVPLFVVLLC